MQGWSPDSAAASFEHFRSEVLPIVYAQMLFKMVEVVLPNTSRFNYVSSLDRRPDT